MRAVWRADRSRTTAGRVRYIRDGWDWVELDQVTAVLWRFVESVRRRLRERGVGETELDREWAALGASILSPEEAPFCTAAARLGLDPFHASEAETNAILSVSSDLHPEFAGDLWDAADPGRLADAARWCAEADAAVSAMQGGGVWLDDLRSAVGPGANGSAPVLPWGEGYRRARAVRARIVPDASARFEFDDLTGGRDGGRFWSRDREVRPFGDRSIGALVGRSADGTPGVVLTRESGHPPADRFTMARPLSRALDGASPARGLITAARSARQQLDRAFAAELLAPADGLAALVTSGTVSSSDVRDLARRYDVTPRLIEHQLTNHEIADVWE